MSCSGSFLPKVYVRAHASAGFIGQAMDERPDLAIHDKVGQSYGPWSVYSLPHFAPSDRQAITTLSLWRDRDSARHLFMQVSTGRRLRLVMHGSDAETGRATFCGRSPIIAARHGPRPPNSLKLPPKGVMPQNISGSGLFAMHPDSIADCFGGGSRQKLGSPDNVGVIQWKVTHCA